MTEQALCPPAWNPDFYTAKLPMMMRLPDLLPRYRKRFVGNWYTWCVHMVLTLADPTANITSVTVMSSSGPMIDSFSEFPT